MNASLLLYKSLPLAKKTRPQKALKQLSRYGLSRQVRVLDSIHKIRANVINFGEAVVLSCLFKDQKWATHYVQSPFGVKEFQIVDILPNEDQYEECWGERENGDKVWVGDSYLYSHVRIRGNYVNAIHVSHGVAVDGEINGESVESQYYSKNSYQIALFFVENANRYLVATKKSTSYR